MKNIYLYGASDDCHEIETDFDEGFESYGDIKIIHKTGFIVIHYWFDSDWGIEIESGSVIPKEWKIKAIQGNTPEDFRGSNLAGQFIHIQIPNDEKISYGEIGEIEK